MQTIYLDISKKQLIPTLYAKQGDVGREFKAVITNNGVADIQTRYYKFSAGYDGASGSGHYTHIDGRKAFETNETNEVVVELAPNMLQAHGDSLFCLTMENEDEQIISLWNIPVSIEKTPGFLSDEIENYYPELHAVLYTEQRLTDSEARQARQNIGAVSADDLHTFDDSIRDLTESVARTVKFTEQTLTEEQQQTARKNISALKVPQKEVASKTIQKEINLSEFGSTELEGSGVVSRDISITPRLEFLNQSSSFDFDVEVSLNGEYHKLKKDDCTVSEAETSSYLQWRVSNPAFTEYVFTISQFEGSTYILLNYNPDDFNLKLYEVQREFIDAPVVTSVNNLPPDENGNLEIPAVLYEQQELTEEQKSSARQNIGAASADIVVQKDTVASVESVKINHSPQTSDAIFLEGAAVSDKDDLLVNALTLRGDFDGGIDNDSVIIRNVHAGENPTDAVNLEQLNRIVGGKKVYEHIATITVVPADDGSLPQHVIFSTDSEGNPFELSDFIVRTYAGFVDGAQSTLYMNVNRAGVITNGKVDNISTSCRGFNIFFRKEADGCWRVEHTASMASTNFYNPQSIVTQSRLIPSVAGYDFSKITSIDVFTQTGTHKQWIENSTFELWGVRV